MRGSPAAVQKAIQRRTRLRVAAVAFPTAGVALGLIGLWNENSQLLLLGLLFCALTVPTVLLARSAGSAFLHRRPPPPILLAAAMSVGWMVFAGGVTAAASWLSFGGDPTKFIFIGSFIGCMAAGASLIHSGWPRRVGDGLHCARCDYTCSEWDIDLRPLQCPECTHYWGYDVRRGRRIARFGLMACGGVIAALAFLGPNLGLIGGMTRMVPTWALLISERSGGGDTALYEALAKRALTSVEEDGVIDRVLTRFATDPNEPGMVFIEALNQARPNSRLSPLARDKVFEVGFPVRIVTPRRVVANQPMPLRLVSTSGGPRDLLTAAPASSILATNVFAGLFLEGVCTDDDIARQDAQRLADEPVVPCDVGRSRAVLWWYQAWEPFGGESPLAAEVTFSRSGRHTVTVHYWVLLAVSQSFDGVKWRQDGIPNLDVDTVRFERRSVTKTVDVE